MVNFDKYIRRGYPILFGLIVIVAIIEASIATWLVTKFNANHNYPSTSVRDRSGFLAFTGWWTVLFGSIYLGFFLYKPESIVVSLGSHAIFLFVTWVFWLAGAASITAALGGGHNCSNLSFNLPYCNQLDALEAFAWIGWIFLTVAFSVVIVRGIIASRRGDGLKSGLVAY